MGFKFENLRVFQFALELNDRVFQLTKSFPGEELFVLTQQMRRACDSVVLNIIEGSTLQSATEFRRFLIIANRSALEVVGCLYLARKRGYIDQSVFASFYNDQEKLVAMIQALIKSLH